MSLLYFLKCTKEEYREYLREQKIEKIEDEIAEAKGKMEGFRKSLDIYERDAPRLVFSNAGERVDASKKLYLLEARRELLEKRLSKLKGWKPLNISIGK